MLEPHQILAAEQRAAWVQQVRAEKGWWTWVPARASSRIAYDCLPLEELVRLARLESRSRKRPRSERVAITRASGKYPPRPPRHPRGKRYARDAAVRLGAWP